MDTNKRMIHVLLTVNDELTQSENKYTCNNIDDSGEQSTNKTF